MTDKRRELLLSITEKDFEVSTFHAGGPGGQNQNKRFTGVRILHKPSGAIGESREERSQLSNKRAALKRLSESVKFKLWLNRTIYEMISGKTIEQRVDELMTPDKIKIEVKDQSGKWTLFDSMDNPEPPIEE